MMWIIHVLLIFIAILEIHASIVSFLYPKSYLRFYYGTDMSQYYEELLSNAEELMNKQEFNKSRKTMCFAPGFDNEPDGPAVTAIVSGALELRDWNVILLNWKEAAAALKIDPLGITEQASYVKAAKEMLNVGTEYGEALIRMSKHGLNLTTLWNIGHSLGAHVQAQAARTTVKDNGPKVGRTTSLDAARILFEDPSILPPPTSGFSIFYDSYHSDQSKIGMNASLADLDVFFNPKPYCTQTDKSLMVQPGCQTGDFKPLSEEGMCSHNKVWKYLVDSWLRPRTLMCSRGDTCWNWVHDRGDPSDVVYIGDDMDQTKRGIYFLNTNSQSPYGMGQDGIITSTS